MYDRLSSLLSFQFSNNMNSVLCMATDLRR
jgi:hypothetical protein